MMFICEATCTDADCFTGMHRHEQGDGGGQSGRGDGEPLQRGHHSPREDPLRQGHLQGGVQLVARGPANLSQVVRNLKSLCEVLK
jgi:hypothetical protein